MGCTRPILLMNKNYNGGKNLRRGEYNRYFEVPCGQCINCRTKRRTELENMLKLQLTEYKGLAVFGTLTYTDEYLQEKGRVVYDEVQNIPYTANHKDFTKFMKRLRIRLERKGYKQKLKYIYCTEYGDIGHRCHIHFVIMGINANCRNIIQEAWKEKYKINGITKKYPIGIVQCDDLKTGGLRYVIKYMDYAPIGTEQKRIWIENGIEPPVIKHSNGLGQETLRKQIKEGLLKNGYFRTGDGEKEVRLSRYYLNKYGFTDCGNPWKRDVMEEMKKNGWKITNFIDIENLKQLNDFMDTKSRIEEEEKLGKLKAQGIDITIYEKKENFTTFKENYSIFDSEKVIESITESTKGGANE